MITFHTYTISFMDDSPDDVIQTVTRYHIENDVLHLFLRNGEYAEEEHLASYPLANVRRWTKKRWP